MAPLCRLWFLLPPAGRMDGSALLSGLAARGLAAVASDRSRACAALATELARAVSAHVEWHPELEVGGSSTLTALQAIAAAHADLELAVVSTPAALAAALTCSLGMSAQAPVPVALRPGSISAFDWPTGLVPGARPLLLGHDLDWLPAWTAGRPHSPFPGGPGAAGDRR